MVLKASEVAPAAYSTVKSSSAVKKENDLTYDLGNLMACDTHPFQGVPSEDELKQFTRENVQLLLNKIFDLPSEMSEVGKLAVLPEPTTVIPREKPLPKPKEETKWQKFAKEKGIQKKKKSRMVLDETTEKWAPSWGYKRANDNSDDWAIPIKKGQDIYTDVFEERAQGKTKRIEKNERQRVNNSKMGRGDQNMLTKTPTGIPVELSETSDRKLKQRGKEGTRKALEKVQVSTASMGKFDRSRQDEPAVKKTGKRNQFMQVVGKEKVENDRSMGILDRIMGKEDAVGKRKATDMDDGDGDEKKRKKVKVKKITRGQCKRGKRG